MRWFGHVRRMGEDRFPRKALAWRPGGRRQRGRPKTTWRSTLEKDFKEGGLSWEEAESLAQERDEWKLWTARCVHDTGGNKAR